MARPHKKAMKDEGARKRTEGEDELVLSRAGVIEPPNPKPELVLDAKGNAKCLHEGCTKRMKPWNVTDHGRNCAHNPANRGRTPKKAYRQPEDQAAEVQA